MAGRILNRRELRRQADAAEATETPVVADDVDETDEDEEEDDDEGGEDDAAEEAEASDEGDEDDEEKPKGKKAKAKPKAKVKAEPKPRKPRKPKAAPRMRARWGVFDASMKQLAIFDWNQRADADAKVVELAAKKNGTFFVQIVKEPMAEAAADGGAKGASK
jgi:cobalamin biosynthesis protein CobT